MDLSSTQGPTRSDSAPTAHTLESPRLPTYTTPSPTVAELGPTVRFVPFRSSSAVANPSTLDTRPSTPSTTSTLPVLPAGTHTRWWTRSYARKSMATPPAGAPGSAIEWTVRTDGAVADRECRSCATASRQDREEQYSLSDDHRSSSRVSSNLARSASRAPRANGEATGSLASGAQMSKPSHRIRREPGSLAAPTPGTSVALCTMDVSRARPITAAAGQPNHPLVRYRRVWVLASHRSGSPRSARRTNRR